jgi:hypothetical protein
VTDVPNEPTVDGNPLPYPDVEASRSVSLLTADLGESIETPQPGWPRRLGPPLLAGVMLVAVLVLVWTGLRLLGWSLP